MKTSAFIQVLLGLLFAGLLLVGCGPVQSTAGISSAEVYLERARVNDAEMYSPYEYYRAIHYLRKAKIEWGYSNFEASRDYANEAERAARAAYDNVREAPWQGHPVLGRNTSPDPVPSPQSGPQPSAPPIEQDVRGDSDPFLD